MLHEDLEGWDGGGVGSGLREDQKVWDVCIPMAQLVKDPPAMWETWVRSLS